MRKIKHLGYCLAVAAFFSPCLQLKAQTNRSINNQTSKQILMKEFILLIRLPINYGPAEAANVRESWNKLTDKWRAENIFVTSFVFPDEGYVVSSDKTAKKESVVSDDVKMISSIIVRAVTMEDALLLAKACPVLEQGAKIEVRETKPQLQQITEVQNKETIRNLYEHILNDRKTELLDELISPDYVGLNGAKGVSGFSGPVLSVIAGFPDIKWTIEELIASGDKVVVRWHWVGTNSAPFRSIPASNKQVTDTAIAIYQLKEGKVINAVIQGDRLGVLTQIGVIPSTVVPASN